MPSFTSSFTDDDTSHDSCKCGPGAEYTNIQRETEIWTFAWNLNFFYLEFLPLFNFSFSSCSHPNLCASVSRRTHRIVQDFTFYFPQPCPSGRLRYIGYTSSLHNDISNDGLLTECNQSLIQQKLISSRGWWEEKNTIQFACSLLRYRSMSLKKMHVF